MPCKNKNHFPNSDEVVAYFDFWAFFSLELW